MKACPMYVDCTRTRMQQLKQSQQSQQLQQQSSSQRGWRFFPDNILPGYQWAPQWVPARTPTVHWGPISGKAVGGPYTVQHSRSQCEKHAKHFLSLSPFYFSLSCLFFSLSYLFFSLSFFFSLSLSSFFLSLLFFLSLTASAEHDRHATTARAGMSGRHTGDWQARSVRRRSDEVRGLVV